MAVNTKDKYYTPEWLVKHTVKKAVEIIGKENITDIIEPSAGDGAFIEELDKLAKELGINVEYYDLYPSHPRIIKMDYKKLIKSYKKGRLIIGNPPFGTSSSLWKAFCKKSAKIGDFIAFISPASQYKSNYYFKEGVLVYSELLNDVEYRGDEEYGGKDQKVRTCLNIYKVYDREEEEDWRIKRLEQDIQIVGLDSRDPLMNEKLHNYDWYLDRFKTIGKPSQTPRGDCFAIKILNENVRSKVDKVMNEFDTKYRNDICRLSNGTPVLSIFKLRDILITNLYPTREERLEQDVKIIAPFGPEENVKRYIDCDFFIARMHTVGAIYENFDDIPTNVKSSLITVRILNKDVKDKVRSVLQNLKEYYKNEYTAATVSTMSNMFLKEYLIKHLYPTREERLEQDVLIERDNRTKEYDFIIDRRGWNLGKLLDNAEGRSFYGIKVLNDNMRTNIESAIKQLEIDFKIKAENDLRSLSMPEVKQQLIKHLYPTREERLEQDVQLVNVKKASKKNNDFICDFYIGSWGAGVVGKIYNDIRYEDQYGVKIHNEEKRKEIEDFFYSYREKYVLTGEQYEQSVGGAWLVMPFLKKHLMDILYPQDDPQFEDFDYPEIRKPVHVERAVHGKPLIPIEYREEIVKTPKEETKVAAVALF